MRYGANADPNKICFARFDAIVNRVHAVGREKRLRNRSKRQ